MWWNERSPAISFGPEKSNYFSVIFFYSVVPKIFFFRIRFLGDQALTSFLHCVVNHNAIFQISDPNVCKNGKKSDGAKWREQCSNKYLKNLLQKMHQQCTEIHRNAQKCTEMHRNAQKCTEMDRNAQTCTEIHRNAPNSCKDCVVICECKGENVGCDFVCD